MTGFGRGFRASVDSPPRSVHLMIDMIVGAARVSGERLRQDLPVLGLY
jgi:hypothetical protein